MPFHSTWRKNWQSTSVLGTYFQCIWEKMSLSLRVVYRISSVTFWFAQHINSTYAFQNVWLILNISNDIDVLVNKVYRSVLAHITKFRDFSERIISYHNVLINHADTQQRRIHALSCWFCKKQLEENICDLVFLMFTYGTIVDIGCMSPYYISYGGKAYLSINNTTNLQ